MGFMQLIIILYLHLQLFQGPQLRIGQTTEQEDRSVYHYTETVNLHCEVTAYPLPQTVTWTLCWRGQEPCEEVEVEVSVVDPSSYVTMVHHNLVMSSSNSSSITVTCSAHNTWTNNKFTSDQELHVPDTTVNHNKSESKTFQIVGKILIDTIH